jgi:sulfite reductase (NADPH) flavoprotein alpha-component
MEYRKTTSARSFYDESCVSREESDKVYVQHRLLEDADIMFDLLERQEACFYICGDAKHMAKDVHHALISIVSKASSVLIEESES